MIGTITRIINIVVQLIILLIIAKVFLSYIVAPYHPVRLWIDRIVEPMLNPIRRVVPLLGGLDISPIILIVLIELLGQLINGLLTSIFR